MFRSLTVFTTVLLLVGCGDDTEVLSYSAPVGINLKAKGDDAKGGTITDEKDITTESGNPYGAFVSAAQAKLGGGDPTRIEVDTMSLLLGAKSKGVTALEGVFTGKVEVLFLFNDTKNSVPVGHVTDPTGTGPVDMTVTFKSTDLGPDDYSKMVKGSFKVVIRGTAAPAFAGAKDTEADLQVTFEFIAL